jgi:hypothetical protein
LRIPYETSVAIGREFISLGPDIAAAILLTLDAGWILAASCPEVHPGAGEVAITERLRDGMRLALKTNRFAWSKSMLVAPGTESRSSPDVLLPDGRTDIPLYFIEVFLTLGAHDPHAIIECKRISGEDADLCREYVIEGIDRFRIAKYGENHAVGFMAGYVLSGDVPAAVVGINAYLTRKARHAECLVSSSLMSWAWRSRHPRSAPRDPIELHHAFFLIGPSSRAV